MFDSMAEWMTVPLLHYEQGGRGTGRYGLAHASIYPYRPYRCQDGELIVAIQSGDEWQRFCRGVLFNSQIACDERFANNLARVAHRHALDEQIEAAFAPLPRSELISRLERERIAWGNLSDVSDLARHPALRRIDVEVGGRCVQQPAPPLHPELGAAAVPELGAHTVVIRREFA
jgi:crotonobetainyl-CoA:carnitine CoA-transferase CaiB-like acyl-CoA transferase